MAVIPASGAKVSAWKNGVKVAEETTGGDGSYTLAVPDGTYTIKVADFPCDCSDEVECPDGCTHPGDEQTGITVSNGQELTGINFLLTPVA